MLSFAVPEKMSALGERELDDLQTGAVQLMQQYDAAWEPLLVQRQRLEAAWRGAATEAERRTRERAAAWEGAVRAARESADRMERQRGQYQQEIATWKTRAQTSEGDRDRTQQQLRQVEREIQSSILREDEQRRRAEEAEKTTEYWREEFLKIVAQRADSQAARSTGVTPRGGGSSTPVGGTFLQGPSLDRRELFEEFIQEMEARSLIPTGSSSQRSLPRPRLEVLEESRAAAMGSRSGTPVAATEEQLRLRKGAGNVAGGAEAVAVESTSGTPATASRGLARPGESTQQARRGVRAVARGSACQSPAAASDTQPTSTNPETSGEWRGDEDHDDSPPRGAGAPGPDEDHQED